MTTRSYGVELASHWATLVLLSRSPNFLSASQLNDAHQIMNLLLTLFFIVDFSFTLQRNLTWMQGNFWSRLQNSQNASHAGLYANEKSYMQKVMVHVPLIIIIIIWRVWTRIECTCSHFPLPTRFLHCIITTKVPAVQLIMLTPWISYLVALEPVWFRSVLEPFPVEDRSREQLELNVCKRTTVSLDHLIEHYSVQLELNWLCIFSSSSPSCSQAG